MRVLNEYPTHHYFHEYEQYADEFCVSCGAGGVWVETGPGDFYCGPEHVCTKCGSRFTVPTHDNASPGIVEQLRSGVTAAASTPRGH